MNETWNEYLTYEEAKPVVHRIARKMGLRTKEDYEKWYDDNKYFAKLIGLPRNPEIVYTVLTDISEN